MWFHWEPPKMCGFASVLYYAIMEITVKHFLRLCPPRYLHCGMVRYIVIANNSIKKSICSLPTVFFSAFAQYSVAFSLIRRYWRYLKLKLIIKYCHHSDMSSILISLLYRLHTVLCSRTISEYCLIKSSAANNTIDAGYNTKLYNTMIQFSEFRM